MVWRYDEPWDRFHVTDLNHEAIFQMRQPWHNPFRPVHPLALRPEVAIERLHVAFKKSPLLYAALMNCGPLVDRITPNWEIFGPALERAVWAGEVAFFRIEREQIGWLPPLPGEEERPGHGSAPPPKPATDTWFELRVVDEMGEPLPGVELLFGFDRQVHVTGADGRISIQSVPTQFHQTRVRTPPVAPGAAAAEAQPLDSLRAAVKPRWDQVRPGPWYEPGPDDVVVQLHGDTPIDISLLSERPRTIVVRPWVIRVRLIGGYFDTNKCFLLPSAVKAPVGGDSDMRRVRQHIADNPGSALLIVGHTDTTGEPAYNDVLSLDRADSVAAYLRHDVEAWLAWYGASKPPEKRWGIREDAAMIQAMPDYPTPPPPGGPVRWYQRTRGLDIDGVAGDNTRRALIREYMAQSGAVVGPQVEMVTHSCGESFQIAPEGSGGMDEGKQRNRRVETYFFDRGLGVEPPQPGRISAPGSIEYPEWVRRASETWDYETAVALEYRLRVCDSNLRPIPGAPCRVSYGGACYAHEADADGWIVLSAPPGVFEYEAEWTTPDRWQEAECPYRRHGFAQAPAAEQSDWQRMHNLGFPQATLERKVAAYQRLLNRPVTRRLDDIRDEMRAWHDGGPPPRTPATEEPEPAKESGPPPLLTHSELAEEPDPTEEA
jgi:outer membrane protein OmpA-like peptidoglycan-associated protein